MAVMAFSARSSNGFFGMYVSVTKWRGSHTTERPHVLSHATPAPYLLPSTDFSLLHPCASNLQAVCVATLSGTPAPMVCTVPCMAPVTCASHSVGSQPLPSLQHSPAASHTAPICPCSDSHSPTQLQFLTFHENYVKCKLTALNPIDIASDRQPAAACNSDQSCFSHAFLLSGEHPAKAEAAK